MCSVRVYSFHPAATAVVAPSASLLGYPYSPLFGFPLLPDALGTPGRVRYDELVIDSLELNNLWCS